MNPMRVPSPEWEVASYASDLLGMAPNLGMSMDHFTALALEISGATVSALSPDGMTLTIEVCFGVRETKRGVTAGFELAGSRDPLCPYTPASVNSLEKSRVCMCAMHLAMRYV